MENNIFTGVREQWKPLYEKLYEVTENTVGKFNTKQTNNSILWKHTSTFTEIRANKNGLVVAFASDKLHQEWNPVKTTQTSKHRIAHYFEVSDKKEFPELVERIKAAYYLTDPDKPAKKKEEKAAYSTVAEYIDTFPGDVQTILKEVRNTITKSAPDAEEKISWQMPTYHQDENLVHFAGFKNHIGFYPGDEAVRIFEDKLKDYKHSKGSIQFPLDKPVPYDLIREITEYRVGMIEK